MRLVYPAILAMLIAAYSPPSYGGEAGDQPYLQPPFTLQIKGLRPCSASADTTLQIDRNKPVIVLTHGCLDSAARFKALGKVFAFQGQQAICFTYNDRDSLLKSGSELSNALQQLSEHQNNKKMTVIAHSQGGLIARKALTTQHAKTKWEDNPPQINLVTISAPFSGIDAANHCGSKTWRTVSLGLVSSICWVISGDKWFEITDASEFIQNPGVLLPQLQRHLKIDTDEQGSCRSFGPNNQCLESDFVFNLDEQRLKPIDQPTEVKRIEIAAGHTEIVGDYQTPPEKLITALQQEGIMNKTTADKKEALELLLSRLY